MLTLETTGRLPRGEPRTSSKRDFPSETPAEPRGRDWSNSLAIFGLSALSVPLWHHLTVVVLQGMHLSAKGGSSKQKDEPCTL